MGHLRARENACVIWIDAHNATNNPYTTLSGNMHGMSLSPILKGIIFLAHLYICHMFSIG